MGQSMGQNVRPWDSWDPEFFLSNLSVIFYALVHNLRTAHSAIFAPFFGVPGEVSGIHWRPPLFQMPIVNLLVPGRLLTALNPVFQI